MAIANRWIRYLLGGLTLFALAGAIYQAIAAARDRRRYPPPGQLIDIGSCRLHLHCLGAGKPVVIMESGSGNFSLDWSLLQAEIAKVTQVCTYDRAGHGWSEAGVTPRTVPQIVEELHTLLRVNGLEGPYILVGHSLGGLYMHYFARRYPIETGGLVLIDAAFPDIYRHWPPTFLRKTERRLKKTWLAARLSLLRLGLLSVPPAPENLPPDIQRIISLLWLNPSFWRTAIEQNKQLNRQIPELFSQVGPFPDIPLVVLTPAHNVWLADISPEFPALWLGGQKKLSQLSPRGKLMIIEESGHNIHHDQPELVAEVICRMVKAVQP
jgi:pimeloyl-ACP methyl ester carboxylesterase